MPQEGQGQPMSSQQGAEPIADIPMSEVTSVPISWLAFDPLNPRFTPDKGLDYAKPVEVIHELMKAADLKELIGSIAANGYIDIEPMIVMRDSTAGLYHVLEGNRRLAALSVLTDPELAMETGIQVPGFTPDAERSFGRVTVYRVADRSQATAFIGFKHINGPHTWDSLAKGRFAADWYKRERDKGVTIRDIARKLGDNHATVRRLVQGIYVLDQARDAGVFDVENRYPGKPFGFSHLYTALTRPGYRKYLNLPSDWHSKDPSPNPVPDEALGNLKQLMLWLYGSASDGVPPAIGSQNPDIKKLGEVLENPIARKEMLASSNLSVAYSEVLSESFQLEQALLKAYRHAEDAQSKLSSYEGDDEALLEVASRLRKSAAFIHQSMTLARQAFFSEEAEKDAGSHPQSK